MRKAIKIKAAVLLLAWSVIFAHGIIPHNHLDKQYSECHNIFHTAGMEKDHSDFTAAFDKHPSGKPVCHFSGFVFQQLNSDNLIISSDKTSFIKASEVPASKIFNSSVLFISDPHPGNSAMRAPPLL